MAKQKKKKKFQSKKGKKSDTRMQEKSYRAEKSREKWNAKAVAVLREKSVCREKGESNN